MIVLWAGQKGKGCEQKREKREGSGEEEEEEGLASSYE